MSQANITVPVQRVGTFGFSLTLPIVGLSLEGEGLDLRALIEKPDGTTVEKTGDDVARLGVTSVTAKIADGDFDQTGEYKYQVWNDGEEEASPASDLGYFYVGASLTPPAAP